MKKQKQIIWINSGDLSTQLHQVARISPARYLAEFGWEVTLVTAKKPIHQFYENLKFYEIKKNNTLIIGTLFYHLRIILSLLKGKIQGDVLFFQTRSAIFLLIFPILQKYFKLFRKLRIVMDTRSVPMNTDGLRGKIKKYSFNFCHFIAKKLPVFHTAITHEMVNYIGIPQDKLLSVWESGVDPNEFEECYKRRKWPTKSNDVPIKIIYIGTITKERNIDSAIEATNIARNLGVNVELNIVGAGPYTKNLMKIAEKYNEQYSNSCINIQPAVDRKKIPDILSMNHIGLLPFPNVPKMQVSSAIKMFEYMAAGMPILATKIAAHVNVFKDNDFVIWDELSETKNMVDAIIEIDLKRDRLMDLGKKSLMYSENYTWEKSAEKLYRGLNSLFEQ